MPPEPRPERQPGETLAAYTARLQEWAAEQNAPPPTAPAANQNKPAGTEVSPGRVISPNGLTTYMYNASTGWTASPYPPSAADKQAAGVGATTSGGGGVKPPTNYAESNARDRAALLIANGGTDKPAGNWLIAPSGVRAYDPRTNTIWEKDKTTPVWSPSSYPASVRTDGGWIAAAAQQARAQGINPMAPPTTPGAPPTTTTTGMGLTSPRASVMPEAPETRTSMLPSSVNQIAVNNPFQGFNGFINPQEGQRAPNLAAQGVGPAVSSNMHVFPGGRGTGYTMADRPMQAQVTTPNWMDAITGRNEGGIGVPATIGVTPGPRQEATLQSLISGGGASTIPLSLAGNNVQFNSPDRSWGTGFVLDAMPASNIAMAQGRNFSGLSPQMQAAATWMLLDEQMNGAMKDAWWDTGGTTTGGPGFGPDGPVYAAATGGRVATGPLGGGKPDLITNGTKYLIDAATGKLEAVMGEDNADADRRPDREAIYLHGPRNSVMDIVPLDPPRFAEGGGIRAGEDVRPPVGPVDPPVNPPIVPPVDPPVTPPVTPPVAPPVTPSLPQPYIPPFNDPYATYDPLNPSIIAPWQKVMNQITAEQAIRDRMQYRRRAGGVGREVGIEVLPGQIPTGPLAPGTFLNYQPQVSNMVRDISNAQTDYRTLGPEEDISGDLTRVGQLGGMLRDIDDLRNLDLDLQVVMAGTVDPNTIAQWNASYYDLKAQLDAMGAAGQQGTPGYEDVAGQMRYYKQQIDAATQAQMNADQKRNILQARQAALTLKLGPLNEADLRTELARRQERIARQDKRVANKVAVANLAKIGVPSLSGPRR